MESNGRIIKNQYKMDLISLFTEKHLSPEKKKNVQNKQVS